VNILLTSFLSQSNLPLLKFIRRAPFGVPYGRRVYPFAKLTKLPILSHFVNSNPALKDLRKRFAKTEKLRYDITPD
jgi:hypothetical protein